MTRIKICGITNLDDARAAVDAGADALGFVLAPSRRRIAPDAARAIVAELPRHVLTVGVFVDAAPDEVRQAVERVRLDCVQLHGGESPQYCAALGCCVVKRIHVAGDDSTDALRARMSRYRVCAFVLDPGAGDGQTFRWERALGLDARMVIAGGLTPENVAAPVRLLRPFAVDVASGVESAPGRKDHARVRAFIQAVRACDAH